MISCHWTSACVASKVCQLGDCEDRLSACATGAILQPEYTCCYYRVCYRCLAVKSIWDRIKPYLVVKISSDIVTEHCCQVCVLSMMFCRSVAVCWHGKWLRNQQETPRSTNVDLNCGRPTWDIKILFTSHRCYNYFMLYFSKIDSPFWPRQSKTVCKIVVLR